ncbi:hypothetical protein FOA52_005537 [Chlamydomonas sp. UWO 241]|nr:hypothetical protein FOA52_005537 [Chlamydomonas sp. UWO 241]
MSEFDDDEVLSSGSGGEGEDSDDGSQEQEAGHEQEQAAPARGSAAAVDGGDRFVLEEEVPSLMEAGSTDAALLALQLNELLAETRFDYSAHASAVEEFMQKLRSALGSIPEHTVDGQAASGFLRDLGFDPAGVSLAFAPPTRVELVGSYGLRTAALGVEALGVDVCVEMPGSCLFKKAHLNYRYHARRALYLLALSSGLKSADAKVFGSQSLCAANDDPTRPALALTLPLHGTTLVVRLIPVPSPSLFSAPKLAPDRNSVRWVLKKGGKGGKAKAAAGRGENNAADDCAPTSHYNSGVLEDMAAACHHVYLARAFKANPRARDVVLLIKAWARQRGLTGTPDTLTGHALTMLVAHVAACGKLVPGVGAMAGFRAVLHALSDAAGLPKGLAIARDAAAAAALGAPSAAAPPTLSAFRSAFDAVLVDPTGWINLAACVTKAALAQTAAAAAATLQLLTSPADADEAFAAALLHRGSTASAFDYVWRVRVPAPTQAAGSSARLDGDGGDGDGGQASTLVHDVVAWREQEASLEAAARTALGNRASLVRALPRRVAPGQAPAAALSAGLPAMAHPASSSGAQQAGKPGSSPHNGPHLGGDEVVVVACVDPTLAMRLVDVGPAADDAKAALRFRAFWGAKSELRRFVDGTICEAVVWDASPADRHTVPDAAVVTALTMHGPPGTSVAGCSGVLDGLLLQGAPGAAPLEQPSGDGRPEGALDANTSVTSFRLMEAAADKLSKQLRAVEDGALKVVGVQSISSFARQTVPFFPLPHELAGGQSAPSLQRLARCVEPVELLVQLESSGKWPDDPVAFAKTKAALSVQLAAALEAGCGLNAVCSEECVDVLVDGFAFRLLFHSTRDEAVWAKQAEEEAAGTAVAGSSSQRTAPLVASWHHGLVSLVAGANPAYAPAARLASRWLSSQMLGNHFAPEAVELLVASVFCGASSLPQPGSRVAAIPRDTYG